MKKSVIMGKRSANMCAALALGVWSAFGAAPAGYYDSLEGKSGRNLMEAVKQIARKGHKTISYGADTWVAFEKTDVRAIDGKEYWWDMYSNSRVPVSEGRPGSTVMNIEHSVANSWWGGTKNDAYKDIVHLNPSDSKANSSKGNYPLSEVSGSKYDNGVIKVGSPVSGQGGGSGSVYEPADEYKGDFARVYFYMFVIYDDIAWKSNTDWMYDTSSDLMLKPWAYNLLLKWAQNDPVSRKETDRNDGIAATQGNRNPFIDLPDLADYIWGSNRGQAYALGDTPVNPDPGTDPDPDPEPEPRPEPGTEPVPAGEGEWRLVASQDDIEAGGRYVVVGHTTPVAMTATLTSTSATNGFFGVTDPLVVTGGVITDLPADAAIITLEANGTGYSLLMHSADGTAVGYVASPGAKRMEIHDAGTLVKVSYDGEKSTLDFGGAGNLYYNASHPRFTTYASPQEYIDLYRFVETPQEPDPGAVGVAEIEDDADDSVLVEVWGNLILRPEGAKVFDLNGREIMGETFERGVYIVTKPTFRRAVKVYVGL